MYNIYEFYRGTLIIGCRFICVFAVLINKVSLQETVEGVIGGSVLLPCSSAEHDLKLQDTDVSWRHNDSEIVYDIVKAKGVETVSEQDPRYKNRVETFPLEYERGNFSIKLTDLTHTDAGEFSCLITPSDEQKTVQLIIKGKENKSNQANQGPGWTVIICVGTFLTVIVIVSIAYVILRRRKRTQL